MDSQPPLVIVRTSSRGGRQHLAAAGAAATLCGHAAQPSAGYVFHLSDCQRCRASAAKQGLCCRGCDEPLIAMGEPGHCRACTVRHQRGELTVNEERRLAASGAG